MPNGEVYSVADTLLTEEGKKIFFGERRKMLEIVLQVGDFDEWLDLLLTEKGKKELTEDIGKKLAFFLHDCAEYLDYGDDRYLRDLINFLVEYRHGDSKETIARFLCEIASELAPEGVNLEKDIAHYQMKCICAC